MHRAVMVLVLLLVVTTAAFATETSWRINIRADDGTGFNYSIPAQPGVYPTPSASPYLWDLWLPHSMAVTAIGIPGLADAYTQEIRLPSASPLAWDIYVAADVNYVPGILRLQAFTTTALPPAVWQGKPVGYRLKMIDNKGIQGAPENGTSWDLPIPTIYTSGVAYWTMPVNLPTIKLSASNSAALFAEGYRLQFLQTPVPEPASISALGVGILGLAIVTVRRRSR